VTKYKRLRSILLKDGNKYAVNVYEWGELTLEGAALDQHREKIQEIGDFYQQQILTGDFIVELIIENIEVNGMYIKFQVGEILHMSENFVVSPQEVVLLENMSNDPNIIKYNYPQLIED
jgi:hypothetical protein